MRLLPLLLLVACALPDEVGVGLGGSSYDYLASGDTVWPLVNDRGEELGVQVWATWAIKPTRMVMIAEERAVEWWRPPETPPVEVNIPEDVPEPTLADEAVKVGDAAAGWPMFLQVGLIVVLLAGLYYLTRKVPQGPRPR